MRAEQFRQTDEPTVVVLDVDQADLALNPTHTRVWAPSGVPYYLPTPGTNQKQALFGAVNSRTGQTHVRRAARKRSVDFQQFVDTVLIPAYPEADLLILIVDGAAIYQSKSTRAWLADRPQVRLVPLPRYAPELNLQEHIWRWLRAVVTHNHFFGSFAALLAAAERFFARIAQDPAAVLRRIGRSLSPWERHFAAIA